MTKWKMKILAMPRAKQRIIDSIPSLRQRDLALANLSQGLWFRYDNAQLLYLLASSCMYFIDHGLSPPMPSCTRMAEGGSSDAAVLTIARRYLEKGHLLNPYAA